MPARCQARATIVCERPSVDAKRRVDQCVVPSVGARRVQLRIFASRRGVSTRGEEP